MPNHCRGITSASLRQSYANEFGETPAVRRTGHALSYGCLPLWKQSEHQQQKNADKTRFQNIPKPKWFEIKSIAQGTPDGSLGR